MDQLIVILKERKNDIEVIKNNSKDKHRSVYIDMERRRIQRQNWILKVLKSLKVLSIQQKKAIHEMVVEIMNMHMEFPRNQINFESNYTQNFINLFVDFYNKMEKSDIASIKTIIRPNNQFVVMDLIKSLLQISRNEFREVLGQSYEDTSKIQRKKQSRKLIQPKVKSTQSIEIQKKVETPKQNLSFKDKIEISLTQKYSKFIDTFNEDDIYAKMNEMYIDLLYSNGRNSNMIQKFLQTCFGPKKQILYNVSGLYTQQQLKQIVKEKNEQSQLRLQKITQLKSGSCTAQQLKENFKMQLEIHQSHQSYPKFKIHQKTASWFPIIILRKGHKFNPLQFQIIEQSGVCINLPEFQSKNQKKIKIYLKEFLQQKRGLYIQKRKKYEKQYNQFNKKEFLDHNNSKIQEIVGKEPIFYRKDVIFPQIRASEFSKEDEQYPINLKTKVKSQARLTIPPIGIKKQIIDRSQIQKQFERGISYSKFIKQVSSKDRINQIIDKIIKNKTCNNSTILYTEGM